MVDATQTANNGYIQNINVVLSFPIHEIYPTIGVRLDVHLENGERIRFTPANSKDKMTIERKTILTAFFELRKQDQFDATLLKHEVRLYYTWNSKKCNRRKQGKTFEQQPEIKYDDTIGRM